MSESNRPKYNVFVSYHFSDRPVVRAIVDGLTGQSSDIKPFYDEELNPGQVWSTEIRDALKMAACMLVFCGIEAGPWQTNELVLAADFNRGETIPSRILIPVLLPNVNSIPGSLQLALAGRIPIVFPKASDPSALRKLYTAVHEAIDHHEGCHRTSDSRFEIQIEVPPEETPTCVVAAPSQVIERRHVQVRRAVEAVWKKHKDSTRFLPTDTKIVDLPSIGTDECIELIRGSELLVLDCIPFPCEPGKGSDISPRAAYCLGMANALGKPAILIARSKESVATVVADGRQASCPQVDIILENELDQRLAVCIWDACNKVTDLLVQDGVKGIHLLPADIKVRTELSGMFYRILSWGVEVLHCCQPLVKEVHPLARHIQEMVEQADQDHSVIEKQVLAKRRDSTRKKYDEFVKAHAEWEKAWAQLNARETEMKRDFEEIKVRLERTSSLRGWFVQESWQKVLDSVGRYVTSARELEEYATGKKPEAMVGEDQIDFGCLNKYAHADELNIVIVGMMGCLTRTWNHAHNMLKEAIEVSLKLEGPKHDHERRAGV